MAGNSIETILEVYADVTCPFAHVGLRRVIAARRRHAHAAPRLRVRAWPLELVNGAPLRGEELEPKVVALRAGVAPTLFAGFDARRFPETTLPALAAEAAAYRVGLEAGERVSVALGDALFELGRDISDPDVIADVLRRHGVPGPGSEDDAAVLADLRNGTARGVRGSPHWFVGSRDFFCPTLRIVHEGDQYDIDLDTEGFTTFERAVFGGHEGSAA